MRISDWSSDVCSSDLRENREIQIADTGGIGGRSEHQKDARVGVIEADRADRVEAAQIVFARRVVALPGDHIERRMADVGPPQAALKLGHQFKGTLALLICRSEERRGGKECVSTCRARLLLSH